MSLMPMFFVSGENFLYQRQISIIPTNVTNLQVRVVLTTTSFDYSKVNADGSDIRFVASVNDNGLVSPLNYYTQVWNTSGTSIIWVKIPTTSTREIFMQYGRSSLTATGGSSISSIMNTGLRYRYYGYGGGASPTVPGGTLDGGGNDQVGPNYEFGGGTVNINDDVLGSFGSRADSAAIIWDGFVIPDGSGTYVFYTTSDDGQRLYIEDSLVINNWVDQGNTEQSYSYSWTDSRIKKIQYDWYENGGGATAKLGWDPITTGKVYGIPNTYLKAPKYSSAYADPYNYTGGVSSENNLFTPGFVTTSLIAYWDAARYAGSYPGSGTVMTDISGLNATNLNLINSPTFSGLGGGAIGLTGTNDYLSTAAALTTAGNSLTFEGWFNFEDVATGVMFGQGPTVASQGLHIIFTNTSTIRFGMYDNDFDVSTGVLSANTWYHLVFTYSNTAPYTKKAYLNGALIGTSGTQTQWAGAGVFNVGAAYSAALGTGNGRIGLARVYHTDLSDAQVLQNYLASKDRFLAPVTSTEVDYLLVGGGGGGGGGDSSAIGAAGGSGGAVTGTYTLLQGEGLTVHVGGGGGGGDTQVTGTGSGSAGSSTVGAGGAGGNAGGTGTSGAGGGGGGGSFIRLSGTIIAAAGGGAGGGGGGEGDQENVGGGAGGGLQPRGVNGTNTAGAAGFNYSGDGGGGGGAGGGRYGGLGQQQGVSQVASGGGHYNIVTATNALIFAGNNGGAATTADTGAISVTNAANWGYGNNAGTGGGGKPGPTVGNRGNSGSAGVVRIKYAGSLVKASGGSISTVGGYTVHTFTSDGTFTII